MNRFLSSRWIALFSLAFSLVAVPVFAQPVGTTPSGSMLGGVIKVSAASGQTVTGTELPTIIGGYINIVIQALAIVLLGYLLWGGYIWMTAQGDSKQVDRAKGMIKNAIIGIVIVASASAITTFVLVQIGGSAASGSTTTCPSGGAPPC